MDKQDALLRIKEIQNGSGLEDNIPEEIKGICYKNPEDYVSLSLGREYGYIQALMEIFSITLKDLWQPRPKGK